MVSFDGLNAPNLDSFRPYFIQQGGAPPTICKSTGQSTETDSNNPFCCTETGVIDTHPEKTPVLALPQCPAQV